MDEFQPQMHSQNEDLQIVGPIPSISTTPFSSPSSPPPFQLPGDWVSELRPRSDGRFDKYYYEPGTGKQFRSLSSIQKYLSGDIDGLTKRLKHHGRHKKYLIERMVDKLFHNMQYYYEPGTRKKFHSLSSFQKYLSEDINSQNKDLQIVSQIPANSTTRFSSPPFQLPGDWVSELRPRSDGRFQKESIFWLVEEKPRNNARIINRFYYEPSTGKKFRSLSSVQKHLSEDIDFVPKSLNPCDTKNMEIARSIFKHNPSFRLPKGWVVKKKPRMRNHDDIVDRTYIEPGTGKKFRSLLSIERHIAEEKARSTPHQLYLTDASNPGYHTPQSSPDLELGRPPAKVKWVLSPVGSIWKPFMNDSPVPDSLFRKWSQASAHILSCRH